MKQVARNASWLTVSHLVSYLIPILELPILARALGVETYGDVVFAQSAALSLAVIVEYGFNLSASRATAQWRDETLKLRELFGSVLLAKLILMIFVAVAVLIGAAVAGGDPTAEYSGALTAAALLYFLASGFSPFWLFQGLERMFAPIVLNLILRLVGLVLLFATVTEPQHGVRALAIMAGAGLLNTVITTVWALKRVGVPVFSFSGALTQLRNGWHTFIYRSSNNLLLGASPAVLGLSAGTLATGIFVPAEKLVRASVGLSIPVLTAFFPYLSRMRSHGDSQYGVRQGWVLVAGLGITGAVGAVLLSYLSPWLIMFIAGEGFESTVSLMAFFVWLIPLRMVNQAIGIAVLLPLGRDSAAGFSVIFAAVMALATGFYMAGLWGATGMALGLLGAEVLLLFLLLWAALRR